MIEIKGLGFSYPDYTKVLEQIDLTVPDGQIVAVLGANGTGKTTLLKLIAGILSTYGEVGEILIDGKSPQARAGEIAFISEAGTYFRDLTPKEYGAFLADFFPKFSMEFYEKLLIFFELEEKPIKRMSKGQKSKVEVAAGVAKGAQYIVMDEPFVGKDMFTRKDFMKALAGTLTGDETIFITTHEIDEIENFIDRVIILKDMKIAADVAIDEMRSAGETLETLMKRTIGYEEHRLF